MDGSKCAGMRTSIDGKVWGVTRVYLRPWLARDLVQVFEDFDGSLGGLKISVEFGDEDFEWNPILVAQALRNLAA